MLLVALRCACPEHSPRTMHAALKCVPQAACAPHITYVMYLTVLNRCVLPSLPAAMRQHSASVALWGTSAVRMAWGSIQEASALYSLMQLFPDSLMEEAGLFQLGGRSAAPTGSSGSSGQASSSIGSSLGSAQAAPSAAGTRGGSSPAPAEVPLPVQLLQLKKPARPAAAAAAAAADHPEAASSWLLEALGLPLPALGASPDGLILHTVRLPLWEVQMALQRATNCR